MTSLQTKPNQTASISVDSAKLLRKLESASAYPGNCETVKSVQTHLSHVFLAGKYAYKVKKTIQNEFVDYSTLEKRRRCCEEELRLDRRYAPGLYIGVVPITLQDGLPKVEGEGSPIEYAVKMHRFPDDALLTERLRVGGVSVTDVKDLVGSIAEFHSQANRLSKDSSLGQPEWIHRCAVDNLRVLRTVVGGPAMVRLRELESWINEFHQRHRVDFERRMHDGHVRECHGDLHLGNVVHWQDRYVPFDGIEFNDEFRWIDVISDVTFLAMDFAAKQHPELCHLVINHYLELTGHYDVLPLFRWYLVYRALVRAKVAAIRGQQLDSSERLACHQETCDYVQLASRFCASHEPRLWITHGVSGSGKSTLSDYLVQQAGVIRIRSDVERKYLDQQGESRARDIRLDVPSAHSRESDQAVYQRLEKLAGQILRAGYSVVVDATFLRQADRVRFLELAESRSVPFAILECQADESTLKERIIRRHERGDDVSDATLAVLDHQLKNQDPLTDRERQCIAGIADFLANDESHV